MNTKKNQKNRKLKWEKRGVGEWFDEDQDFGLPLPVLSNIDLSEFLKNPPRGCSTEKQREYALALINLIRPTSTHAISALLGDVPHIGDLADLSIHASSHLQAESTVRRLHEAHEMILSALAFMSVGWPGDRCLVAGCKNEIIEARLSLRPGTKICTACKAKLEELQTPSVLLTFTQPGGPIFTSHSQLEAA